MPPPPLPSHPRPLKWIILSVIVLSLCTLTLAWFYSPPKPRFPSENLLPDDASLTSTVEYNPYADYPPRHRFHIGLKFKAFQLHPDQPAHAPFITYALDLDQRGWTALAGTHDLQSQNGSDFWYGDDNLGTVYLEKIEIRRSQNARFEMVLHFLFDFQESGYRAERKQFTVTADYEGLSFIAPIWNNRDEVKLPASWGVPSVHDHWSDEEIKTFVAKYVDLSQYNDLQIDQSGSSSVVKAKPR